MIQAVNAFVRRPGSSFKFLSANVFTDVATRKTLFPAYTIREFQGVKVAFIGMTLEGTRSSSTPLQPSPSTWPLSRLGACCCKGQRAV